MMEIRLSLPEEATQALGSTADQCAAELRLAAAMKLHELGRLSSGAAARLAGLPRLVFLSRLADYGIDTFKLTKEELLADVDRA